MMEHSRCIFRAASLHNAVQTWCDASAVIATIVIVLALVSPVNAATLTLTPAGVAAGFTLSTFATMDPGNTGCCSGPFGLAVAGNGNVLVSNGLDNMRYAFADVDGQTKATALNHVTSNTSTTAYATAGGQAYGSNGSRFVQFNGDGTVNHILTGVSPSPFLGMWGNPVNGHLIATSSSGLIDIDPNAGGGVGSFRVINGASLDGIAVSPDGMTVFCASSVIVGYSIATGAQVFNSGGLANGPDGSGVITSLSSLNGDIIVNFNGNGVDTGQVGLLDPVTKVLTIIASGGTRGDYVAPDTTNGTLFLDYSDVVYRLSCGPNCAIGGPPPSVPEPSTLALLGLSLVALAVIRYRKAG